MAELKRLLGLHSPDRGAPGQRRKKRVKRKIGGSGLKGLKGLKLHEIPIGEWKDKLDVVKGCLPEKPIAKQRAMSSIRIIKHPVHNFTKPPAIEQPPVAIEGLITKFGQKQ
jgi:hypothetical protein